MSDLAKYQNYRRWQETPNAPAFGDGREEMIDHDAVLRELYFCRHPFERLLRIRGSLMCPACGREIDHYGSPLDQALLWWQEHGARR